MTGLEELDLGDFSHDGMTPHPLADCYQARTPEDAWLARRTHAFGGSELAPLLVAYDLAPLEAAYPEWVAEQAELYDALGLPKLIAWKADLRARPGGDKRSKESGKNRERELLGRYRAGAARHRVDPKTIRHADTVPTEWFPLVDRYCTRIAVTPDAWARAARDGRLVIISLKCTYKPCTRAMWHQRVQLQAEIATMDATGGIVVVGEHWIFDPAKPHEKRPDGPVRAFVVEPNAEQITLNRLVATEAWSVIEELRAYADDVRSKGRSSAKSRAAARAHCASIWARSLERMRAYRDPTREHIESALEEIEGLDGILLKQSA